MRARALTLALVLLATSGCASSTAESTATQKAAVPPHVIDYLVVLNSATQYNTLNVQYTDAQGEVTDEPGSSITWSKHLRTKEGVSYVSLVGSAVNNGQQPPAGLPVEMASVQCTITVDGVEASTSVNPIGANCQVQLDTWKPTEAPSGG